MTAVKLPGQMEVPLVVEHARREEVKRADVDLYERELKNAINTLTASLDYEWSGEFRKEIEDLNTANLRLSVHKKREMRSAQELAKLLRSYDESPTSQKWIDIQQLAREILK